MNYNGIIIEDVIKVWGIFGASIFISVLGVIVSRARKNFIISWIATFISIVLIFIFSLFGDERISDPFGAVSFDKIFYTSTFFLSTFSIASLFISLGEIYSKEKLFPEYFLFITLGLLGGIILTSSKDLLTLFIAIELMSFPIYAMVYALRERIGVEASFKYFISGAIFSLFYLFGFSLYLMSEETISIQNPQTLLGIIGIVFVLFSLLFKAGAAPFHFWVPDVYQGAPSSTVSFAGSVVKFSSFVAILRISEITEGTLSFLISAIVILSVAIGALSALVQKEIKRLIAYSSISHSGFIALFILALGNHNFREYFMFYLTTYGIATVGIFGILSMFKNTLVELQDICGFARVHRFFGMLISIFLIYFSGIPATAGFIAKYLAFYSALSAGEIIPVIVAGIGSLISLYFYFLPPVRMFMDEIKREVGFSVNPVIGIISLLIAIFLILSGFFPNLFFTAFRAIPLSS